MNFIPAKASKELKEERRDVCNKCELFKKDVGICGECYCIVKLKTALAGEKCPIGKW
jgi:hypothetical protein